MKKNYLLLVATGLSAAFICSMPQLSLAGMRDSKMMKETVMNEKIAIGGFCPSCLIHGMKMKGKAEFTTVYEGKTYMFSSQEMKDYFDQDPAVNAKAAQMKFEQEANMMAEKMDGMNDKMMDSMGDMKK